MEFNEAKNFSFVGNNAIGTNFGLFDVAGIDTENNFGIFFEFLKKANFKIWFETRQHAHGVIIVYKFTPEF